MNVTSKVTSPTRRSSTDSRAGKYLSFHLASEEYAIQVIKVREIVKLQHITTVPETPAELKGVINLRGKVIPVIDLRLRFGLPVKEYDLLTCIVVVELARASNGPMGLIVDNVDEVMMLQETDIQDTPNFGIGVETPYLLGMAKMEDGVKILLDIDEVLTTADLSAITALAS